MAAAEQQERASILGDEPTGAAAAGEEEGGDGATGGTGLAAARREVAMVRQKARALMAEKDKELAKLKRAAQQLQARPVVITPTPSPSAAAAGAPRSHHLRYHLRCPPEHLTLT